MVLLVPDEGEVGLLEHSLNKVASADLVLRLYTDVALTIDEDTVLADFTEAVAAGYSEITLAGADWTISSAIGVTTAEHVQKTFTFTAASTNYGYYVVNAADNKVMWAEEFGDAPHIIPGGGGTEKITVKIIGE